MPDVSEDRLQAASHDLYGLDYPGGLRLATGLNLDPNGICRTLYGKELNACFTELLGDPDTGRPGILASHALLLDGTSGCWCSTPDVAALDIIGDIDIRAEYMLFGGGGANQTVIGKWNAAGSLSYRMHTAFGLNRLDWSADGTAVLSSANAGVNNVAVRNTLDVVNGANRTMEMFTSPQLGLGTLQQTESPAGNTAIFNSTAALGLGAIAGGTAENFKGRIIRAEVRNGIDGTVVANPDFRNLAAGTTSFVDGTGKTWTVHGTARVV